MRFCFVLLIKPKFFFCLIDFCIINAQFNISKAFFSNPPPPLEDNTMEVCDV